MDQFEKKLMGSRIKKQREKARLSQDKLAEKLGMKRTNIANYEAGRVIPPSNVLRDLTNIFNITADYLIIKDGVYDLGIAIKEEREEQGLTQKELGEFIGVDQRKLSHYELGTIPVPYEFAEKIAEAFGMSSAEFLEKYNMFDEHIPEEFDGDVNKFLEFEKAKEEDALSESVHDIQTIAAHHDGDAWTNEELEEIERFKAFVKSKRKDQG